MAPEVKHPTVVGPNDPTKQVSKTVYEQAHTLTDVASAAGLATEITNRASADSSHVAAGDPHTGYRLESADHNHQSTGAQGGQLDHGLALTGLGDDDHPQYDTHAEVLATKLDDFTAPDDNTDLNVSTSKHGLTPKLPNDVTKYLDGTGAYSVPAGAGSGYNAVEDEGGALTARSTINFTGAGVTAADSGGKTVVTIPGGGGGGGSTVVSLYKPYTVSAVPNLSSDFQGVHVSSPTVNAWTLGGGKLTDGVKGPGLYNDNFNVGWDTLNPVVRIDLGSAMDVTSAKVWGLANNSNIYSPSAIKVEHSDDDSAWTTDENRTGLTGVSVGGWFVATFTITSGSHRYWRVTVTRMNQYVVLNEIELFG